MCIYIFLFPLTLQSLSIIFNSKGMKIFRSKYPGKVGHIWSPHSSSEICWCIKCWWLTSLILHASVDMTPHDKILKEFFQYFQCCIQKEDICIRIPTLINKMLIFCFQKGSQPAKFVLKQKKELSPFQFSVFYRKTMSFMPQIPNDTIHDNDNDKYKYQIVIVLYYARC